MCIIISAKKGASMLPKEYFDESAYRNPDGFGIMYAEDGVIVIDKSLKASDIWDKYTEVYDRIHKVSGIVLHFRIGTSGGNNLDNCHPFYVTDDVAFCHNGILDIAPTPTKSDTVVFNENYLRPIASQMGSDILMTDSFNVIVSKVIGGNKLVFLNKDGELATANADKGITSGDYWFSNNGYKKYVYQTHPKKWSGKTPRKEPASLRCFVCLDRLAINDIMKITTTGGEIHMCKHCAPFIEDVLEAQEFGISYQQYEHLLTENDYSEDYEVLEMFD